VTQTSERTATENLLVTIDLSESVPLNLVAEQTRILRDLYTECRQTEIAFRQTRLDAHREALEKYISGEEDYPGEDYSSPQGQSASTVKSFTAEDVLVRRMSIASPWQIVLTHAITSAPYAVTAASGGLGLLWGLKYLLELKMRWDTHGLQMARGKVELERLELENAVEIVRQFRGMVARMHSIDESATPAAGEEFAENVRQLFPVTEVQSITDDDPRA
jgi:hypothetical protein